MNNNNHHYMGIEMNNQTWSLLDKKDRSEQDDIRMINYAKASLYHWRKSDKALSYAKETLKITKDNNLKDFDLAYAYESMTRAYSIAKNQNESKEWYKKAKVAGDLIVSEKDKEYFLLDLNSK